MKKIIIALAMVLVTMGVGAQNFEVRNSIRNMRHAISKADTIKFSTEITQLHDVLIFDLNQCKNWMLKLCWIELGREVFGDSASRGELQQLLAVKVGVPTELKTGNPMGKFLPDSIAGPTITFRQLGHNDSLIITRNTIAVFHLKKGVWSGRELNFATHNLARKKISTFSGKLSMSWDYLPFQDKEYMKIQQKLMKQIYNICGSW